MREKPRFLARILRVGVVAHDPSDRAEDATVVAPLQYRERSNMARDRAGDQLLVGGDVHVGLTWWGRSRWSIFRGRDCSPIGACDIARFSIELDRVRLEPTIRFGSATR